MNLYMILYTAGVIGGVIGPLPYGMDECIVHRNEMTQMQNETLVRGTDFQTGAPLTIEQRFDVAKITAECEYSDYRPALGNK